ncbi:hypothetical protein K437DRAFT_223576 [Tilletiaria anomala UBC 951]|uniref:Uncharacterized protein n=1 Tax=Tilletiaria anomala (strain ATCC 24038 / CBS 436.72 / UBC 951) TaxID=1037660 RepID=A0A066W5Y1_TILAU|nr:uncharacterized protein K437DRAFT_223576 [Tilletiaria anomala UBC 951]KDN46489.1 hypothetical protein K437DRAFT_223576 [Tilletiaria anomala UBC 951]
MHIKRSQTTSTAALRSFHTTLPSLSGEQTQKQGSSINATPASGPTYHGPLVRTFARLKLFSLGSLFLAVGMCPVLLLTPGAITMAGRIGLCATALATSGVSTALIAWIGGPYVGRMRLVPSPAASEAQQSMNKEQSGPVLQLETLSVLLRPIRTNIYHPSFVRSTSRPFATWELASSVPFSQGIQSSSSDADILVAESIDVRSGKVKGRWWATPSQSDDGKTTGSFTCRREGKPVRYFNVHDELLGEDWQIL